MKKYINESSIRRITHASGKKCSPGYLAHLEHILKTLVSIHIKSTPAKIIKAQGAQDIEGILLILKSQGEKSEIARTAARSAEKADFDDL